MLYRPANKTKKQDGVYEKIEFFSKWVCIKWSKKSMMWI